MKTPISWISFGLSLGTGMLCLAFAVSGSAQVQTTHITSSSIPTRTLTIEGAEVVAVRGNDLFVKMADGSVRDFPNVPAGSTVTVDGQQVAVHDLKPGTKLAKVTVTSSTPKVVTTVQTVTGKVWHVTPPLSVILTLENGTNQKFMIPDGQKFMVDGQEADAFGLKKGMTINATKITETKLTSVSSKTHLVGTFPPDSAVLVSK
jgi:hypothetical protein